MAYEQHIQASSGQSARCAVLTLSDTRTQETDTSGQKIRDLLAGAGHVAAESRIIPDDIGALRQVMDEWLSRPDIDAILTNGGTGISRRDQTIDIIQQYIDKPLPGFGELFRMLSWEQIGSGAMLSRAAGGISRGKIVFAMPGSTKAVDLAMTRLILPEMGHLLGELRK